MPLNRTLGFILVASTGVAWAHEGVRDTQVLARMDSMKEMGGATKVLVEMARGQTDFDATEAEAALERLIAEGKRTPALFEPLAEDPKSEAKPAIWEDFADFTGKSDALVSAASSADVSSPATLRVSVGAIGAACGACHDVYRE